ncbi:Ff.00g037220.m01.CDS01 [Fusarium sp. VM40]|nr:Ff.00g037220.m01.CDS01 [Fusarium sp. VM40]
MNGTQSPDPQKASNTNTNGSNSNNSSLAAKKRKKDLKPIITMEGAKEPAGYV